MTERHTSLRNGKRLVWYTEQLWALAAELPAFELSVTEVAELDQDCWFENRPPTLREVAKHCQRIVAADLRYPIILNADGSLMDGGHRLCKALADHSECRR